MNETDNITATELDPKLVKIIRDLQKHNDWCIRATFDVRPDQVDFFDVCDNDDNDIFYSIKPDQVDLLNELKIIKVVSDWQPSIMIRIIRFKLTDEYKQVRL